MITIIVGNCMETLKTLPDQSVNCCVTSPPYFGLRDYGHPDQIGNESTPDDFVGRLVDVFAEVHRVLRDDGTLWLNLGDSYAGSGAAGNQFGQIERGLAKYKQKKRPEELKPKDLIGIPWRVAFALQSFGWYLRQDIIWAKPNPMPESVTDRCTKAHEYIFLLAKSEKYFYDQDAIRVQHARTWDQTNGGNLSDTGHKKNGEICQKDSHPNGYPLPNPLGANRKTIWNVPTKPFSGAHFATFPEELIAPCILAGCPEGGTVLDPFGGAGTTGLVAQSHNRKAILCELNPEYAELARQRINGINPMFCPVEVVNPCN